MVHKSIIFPAILISFGLFLPLTVYANNKNEVTSIQPNKFSLEPLEICEKGELVNSNKCLVQSIPILDCSSGYEKYEEEYVSNYYGSVIKTCKAVEVVPKVNVCPENSVFSDGNCLNIQKSAIKMICPVLKINNQDQYNDYNGKCVEFHSVSPEPYCNNGYPLEDGFCIGVQLVPCPKDSETLSSPNKKVTVSRMLNKQKKDHEQVKLCEKTINVTPDLKCPEGALERRGKRGNGKNLTCLIPHNVAPVAVCLLSGGVISENGTECSVSIPVEPILSCPPNFSECDEKGLHFLGKCCRVDIIPAELTCPPNFELIDNNCIAYTKSTLACNKDYVLVNGKCINGETYPGY